MKLFIKLFLIVTLGISLAQASVGKITALSGNATLERGSTTLPAKLGSSLEAKDTIVTTNDAKVQLTFNDNTIITVGKKSKFSIEEYLFDATTESTAKFNMVNGTIRAMSGKIGKIAPDRFAVKTKTATIGIRGTDFIIQTSENGDSQFFCMQGAITIRSNDGEMIIIPAGSYVTISPSGEISGIKEFTPEELNTLLKNSLSVTTVHTNEEITQIEPDSVVEFVSQTSPALNPDESLDRGTGINVETLATEVGSTLTTDSINMLPRTFTGYLTYLNRYQNGGSIDGGGGTLSMTSYPASQSVIGAIDYGIPISLGTMNSYSGVDSFDVQLDGLISGSHLSTTSNTANDPFAWGEWNIVPNINNSDDKIFHGYWAAGSVTPSSVISGFTGSMTYTGSVIGEVQQADSTNAFLQTFPITAGSIGVVVDFGADSFVANLNLTAGYAFVLTYTGGVSNSSLSSSGTPGFTKVGNSLINIAGTLDGSFYGANGKIVGGVFNAVGESTIDYNKYHAQGAFKATAP